MKKEIKKVLHARGNKKLPKTTFILNCGSAKNCPSRKKGLCQCPSICYAEKAEKQYPQVLPFREAQRVQFSEMSAEEIANGLLYTKTGKRTKIETFRFSEAGDFEDQNDLVKMAHICRILGENGVRCYGYTARTDLNLEYLLAYSKVNVSNDLNEWREHGANRFLAVDEHSIGALKCAGDCSACTLCLEVSGKVIEVPKH